MTTIKVVEHLCKHNLDVIAVIPTNSRAAARPKTVTALRPNPSNAHARY